MRQPDHQETEIIPRDTDTTIIPGMHYPPPAPTNTWEEEPTYGEKIGRVRDFGHLARGIQTLKFTALLLANGILLVILLEFIKLFFLKGHHG